MTLSQFRPGSAPTATVRMVAVLVLSVIALGGAMMAYAIVQDRAATLAAADQTLTRTVLLMEEHTRAALETEAVILRQMQRMVQARGGMAAVRGNAEDWQTLDRIRQDVPAVQSLWIFDRDGRVVQTTIDRQPPSGLFSDREYFRMARDLPAGTDYVSPLIWGRVTGGFLFVVSRRVDDAHGNFAGVVESSLYVENFTNFYKRLDADPAVLFGIYKRDGSLVMRYPLPPSEAAARRLPNAVLFAEARKRPEGTFEAKSQVDGITRLVAFRSIAGTDLLVAAGRSMESILADWRRRTLHGLALAGGVLVALLLLAWATVRAVWRAEDARITALEAKESKAKFFAAASHDLRQPYQAMRLFLSVIQDRLAGGEDRHMAQAVGQLDTAMASGEQLLNALLDVASLEAGSMVPRLEEVRINDLIMAERDTFARLAEARGLSVRVVPCGAVVRTDPVLLRRILRNLLVNALKYTASGKVLIGCRRRGGAIELQVCDTGLGIPDDKREAIFEDFYQLDNPSRTRSEGLGLGLSVVSRTARLLGHAVVLESRVGRGSIFGVVLPRA
jgi:signal transduction histidine kinase